MKLSSITIRGMHTVKNKTYDLSGFRYFYGDNGAGKTTIMQAVQLALLGYIPGTDKTKSAIFKHSDGRFMQVELHIDDDGKSIVITRTWEKKGKDIAVDFSVEPAVYDVSGIVGNLELPVFNFNEFVGMTANKLKDWFISFLPPADAEIDWNYELNHAIEDFGKILDPDFVADTVAHAYDLSKKFSGVQLIRNVNLYMKEQLSAYKAMQTRVQSTIQSLVYYNDCDNSVSIEELEQANNEAQMNLKNLQRKQVLIEQNQKIEKSIKSVKEVITAECLQEDVQYQAAKNHIAELEKELDVAEETKFQLERQITELNASYKEKERIVTSNGICPYTCDKCDAITTMVNTFKTEMEEMKSKIESLINKVGDVEARIKQLNANINAEVKVANHIEDGYVEYELLSKQKNSDVECVDPDKLANDIVSLERDIKLRNDTIIKLKANKQYEELTDKMTNEKYCIEQNIEILKVWGKLTDMNGLQSALMKAPFERLAERMSDYIEKFFSGTDGFKVAAFVLTEKANSFSFGLMDENSVYIGFDYLSSGEKCLFTLAMLLSIVEMSDSPLKMIMIDDLLDHLDADRITNCFKTLYAISDVQILLAGVQTCNHEKADEFVVKVE